MLIVLIPFAISQFYSGSLRECSRPVLPLVSGTIAVFVNLIFNYILIFGHFGFEAMGVRGAAIATVISRFVEMFIIIITTHATKDKTPFIKGVYRSLYIPAHLVRSITAKTMPLMVNEAVWSTGMAALNRSYSLRGVEVVAASNILHTFYNVFSVAYIAIGVSIGILLGQKLGETTDKKPVLDYCKKLITFSCMVSVGIGILFFALSDIIPKAYNYPESVRDMATALMRICAIMLPTDAFAHANYFTLRAGGKTLVTLLFDSGYVWAITVVAANILVRFTALDIIPIYIIVEILYALRCVIGVFFVSKGSWIQNIVNIEEKTNA
jgi:Na+-driven multidrug efflux pump